MKDERLKDIYLINKANAYIISISLFLFVITGSAMCLFPILGASIFTTIVTMLLSS